VTLDDSHVAGRANAGPNTNTPIVEPDVVAMSLRINGANRTVAVPPWTTLAEALRGPLGLTGTQIACN